MSEAETITQVPLVTVDRLASIVAYVMEQQAGHTGSEILTGNNLMIVEILQGTRRTPTSETQPSLVICPSFELAKMVSDADPNARVIVADANYGRLPIASGVIDTMADPHKLTHVGEPSKQGPLTPFKRVVDAFREVVALRKMPAIVTKVPLMPRLWRGLQGRYASIEQQHETMKLALSERLTDRLRNMTPDGRLITSIAITTPGVSEPLHTAKHHSVGEIALPIQEALDLFSQAGYEVEGIAIGLGGRNRFVRVIAAVETAVVSVIVNVKREDVHTVVDRLSLNVVPIAHKTLEAGLGTKTVPLYTYEQVQQLIKEQRIGSPDRMIVVARKKAPSQGAVTFGGSNDGATYLAPTY